MAIWLLATAKNENYCSFNELRYRKILAQGWPKIGDLSVLKPLLEKNEELFIEIINKLVESVYGKRCDRNPGRIIRNLMKISENDFVLCTEGIVVKGIAKINTKPSYRYDKGADLYEYAQTIFPVTEWKDWDVNLAGSPPPISARGPIGIDKCSAEEHLILDAWGKL